MFDYGYFGTSPFGQGDLTANSGKLISGGDWYSTSDQLNQDNPWLISDAQSQGYTMGEYGMEQQTRDNKSFNDMLGSKQSWYSGDIYQFGNGNAVPVEFLYGYDKFGIGKNYRNELYNMVNWDQYKGVQGIKTPDDIAAELWGQHYQENKHGYTDDSSSSGTSVLSKIANAFMNQDYFKNQRNGQELDITQNPNWANFAQRDADVMGTAMANTQHMNAGSGAIISRGAQQFIQMAIMAYLGTGGWGELAGAAGAGEGAAATGAAEGATASEAGATYGGQGMDEWGTALEGYDYGGAASDWGAGDYSGWGEGAGGATSTDWSVPAEQYSSSGLEANDWGGAAGTGMGGGGNTGLWGSTPYDAAGNWAGTGGGGWQQLLQQAMRAQGQMNQPSRGGGGAPQQSGNYQLPLGQLLAGLLGAYGNNRAVGQQRDLMNQAAGAADPFASQRGFYQDQLRASYQDPTQLWNSPAWQTLRQQMLQDSTAKDAASGRLTDFGNRDQRVAASFMGEYLPRMQQGLMAPSGANSNPAAVGNIMAQLGPQGIQAGNNQIGSLGSLLNILINGQQPSTLDKAFGGAPAQNDNLFTQLWNMINSGKSTNYVDVQ